MADRSEQKPWKLLRSKPGPGLPIFKVRYDWRENPRNNSILRAVVLNFPDRVGVSAIRPGHSADRIQKRHDLRF